MTKNEIASIIDHTVLAPNARTSHIEQLCAEAVNNHFASVCVNPNFVSLCASLLKGTGVKTCTVIGFPLGAIPSEDKASETTTAIKNGAKEVDMVIDITAALDGRFDYVEEDIKAVVKAARSSEKEITVKVILETCFLDDETIRKCCLCAKSAGADFVKTSTGFAHPVDNDGNALPNGATVHHVRLMRETVGPDMGVKASGGIRNAEQAKAMVEAGANRIGTSGGIKILSTWE
ncbi:MAG: deoxyribose-phosphate aldolase [Treponema sp.]|nr:deoxyribose-phosphate aldolase [Treponema sp.]